MNHVEIVQSLYSSFQKGDVPAILEHCADNIHWDHTQLSSGECPWNGNFSGKNNVPGFFKALAENLNFSLFEPKAFLHTGDQVAVHLRVESVVTKTGKKVANDAIHFWTFDADNRVISYRHFNDTGAELAAWKA